MRKWMVALSVVLLLSVSSSIALADGMILPEALSPDYLAVRYHRVTVEIDDGHAVTRVEQEFYNPHPSRVEGRYMFPVPPGAILSRFQATVDGQVQRVVRQDAATTNAALYAAVAERRDPSLLQYADWETLAFDLSLPPGGTRRMVLEYEEMLVPAGGLYHYRYVLGTERYSSQPLEQVAMSVNVHLSAGISSLYSPGYPVTTRWLGSGQAQASWEAQNAQPLEDFDLYFAPADGGFGGGLLAGQRNGQDHFLFLFSPESEPASQDTMPKDIVFVIDRSGSMNGEKIEQARSALLYALGRLGPDDRFGIVSFNDQASLLATTLQPAGGDALVSARRYAEDLSAEGSTDLQGALQAGLQILSGSERRAGAARIVLFLTDGLPTAGITDEALIARNVAQANAELEARLHVFGVGYDVNTILLDRLSADSGGTVTYVQPGENLEEVLTGFYDRIARPLLTDVSVEFSGMRVSDLYPQRIPDLFQGSSLVLAGRYRADGDTATVRVRGRAGGEQREYIYSFDLRQAGGHDFVPRLWATRQVGALLDQVRVQGESPALVEEIRGLGLSYGLVTPYTTFVVQAQAGGPASAENMALYQQAGLNQTSGQTTVQARVQNQAYQQADQAGLAGGANVVNNAQSSLAQIAALNVDLALFQGQKTPDEPVSLDWIARNIGIDRIVDFGSAEYFALAKDPVVRSFLQSGANVVFSYQGKVISVQEGPASATGTAGEHSAPTTWFFQLGRGFAPRLWTVAGL